MGFFGLSGFLVSGSYENTNNVFKFALKRFRRIFPGFWACLLVTAFLIGPIIGFLNGISFKEYPLLGDTGAVSYITNNFFISIKQHNIGSIIEKNAWPGSLNGSLWSLHPEIICYITLAILGLSGSFSKSKWLVFLIFFILGCFHLLITSFGTEIFPKSPSFLVFSKNTPYITAFFAGACIYKIRENLTPTLQNVAFLGLVIAMLIKFGGFHVMSPFLIPMFLLLAGSLKQVSLSNDLSYGVYIYSFPLQQLLYSTSLLKDSVFLFCICSVVLSLIFAFLSWKIIEQPFLHRSKKQ